MSNNPEKKKKKKNRKRNFKQKKIKTMQKIAQQRIEWLMQEAINIYSTYPERAQRYVVHSRKISMATKVRIPKKYKRYICHGCKKLIIPGKNMTFRIHKKRKVGSYLSVKCLECGHITRYFYKKHRKKEKLNERGKILENEK